MECALMPRDLTELLAPHSVAVVGASPRSGSVAGEILRNIISCGYKGKVYPVNPKYEEVDGLRCYNSIDELPEGTDLAVLAIKGNLVLEALGQCIEAGITNLVMITAGFKESGKDGIRRENQLKKLIEKHNLNVVGPNCMGIINADPKVSLNASFSRWFPSNGEIAFISQSGSLGETVLEFFEQMKLGISQFINLGNRAGLSENDFLDYLAHDPYTHLFFLYLESFADPHLFRSITERIGRSKPVVVLKSGRTQAGAAAVASHTGSLTSPDAIVDAFLNQSGAIRVSSIKEALTVLGALKWGVIPKGNKVVLLTNAGGAGIIAADACERAGIKVPQMSKHVKDRLATFLPPEAGLANPIDVIATATSANYEDALRETLNEVDAAIVIFRLPLVFNEPPEDLAEGIVRVVNEYPDKPVLVCTLSHSPDLELFRTRLTSARIPVYTMPENAVDTLASLCRVQKLYRAPRSMPHNEKMDSKRAGKIIQLANDQRQTSLTFAQGADLLAAYRIPVCAFSYVQDIKQAQKFASAFGYPVVAKIDSVNLFHRFERGAVVTGIKDKNELSCSLERLTEVIKKEALSDGQILLQPMIEGRELIMGMNRDPSFGPVIMFGIGGTFVEALKDVSFGVAPLSIEHAQRMIRSIRSFPLLKEFRGNPAVNIASLSRVLHNLSQLSLDIPQIAEIDLNPFIAGEDLQAVDILIQLRR
jgi:acetate---CoA ligase (ADP-forming)